MWAKWTQIYLKSSKDLLLFFYRGDDTEKMPLANRTQTIIRHRAEINSLGKFFASIAKGNSASQPRPRGRNATYDTVNPGGGDFPPKFFDKLRPINIGDMDPYQCTPSKGDKITLDIVEDAQSFTRVMLLGQVRPQFDNGKQKIAKIVK